VRDKRFGDGGVMTSLHSYGDTNQQTLVRAESIMTDENQHEVRCGMCAREIYVDEDGYQFYNDALLSGSENLFRCEICSDE
jgi:hypothetical protein